MSKTYKEKFNEAIQTATDLEASDMKEIGPWLKNLKEGDQEFYYQFMLEYYFDGGKTREFSLLNKQKATQSRNRRNIDILMGTLVSKPGHSSVSPEELNNTPIKETTEEELLAKENQEQEERIKTVINSKGTKGLLKEMVDGAMKDIGYSEEEDRNVINKLLERAVVLALIARSSGRFGKRGKKKETSFF